MCVSWSLRHCQPVQELSDVTTNAYQGKMLTTMLAAAVAAAHAVHPLDPPTREEITSALASSRALYPHPEWRVYVTSLLLPSPSLSLPPTMPSVSVDVCHLPWRNVCARVRVGVRTRGGQGCCGCGSIFIQIENVPESCFTTMQPQRPRFASRANASFRSCICARLWMHITHIMRQRKKARVQHGRGHTVHHAVERVCVLMFVVHLVGTFFLSMHSAWTPRALSVTLPSHIAWPASAREGSAIASWNRTWLR
jgi:hypothetical protein